jgi:type I restriction enzyme S subunit
MDKFQTETVENSLERLSLGSSPKLQMGEYRATGKYPIIDQGQGFIAGWTEDERGLIATCLPVVVFGDHTRAFKYVDFPFVRGADGTQVLKPREGIDTLFFYYACRAIDLPGRGYNRHFTILKEKTIPIPDPQEQRKIGTTLRQVEDGIEVQTKQLIITQGLKSAAMRELFTHGLRGEAQKETEIGLLPESWSVVKLGTLGRVGNGSTPKKTIPEYWTSGTYPWLTSAKVYDREIIAADQFVTTQALNECHLPRIKPGAVLIAITGKGKTLGHCAVLKIEATINQHIAYVATDTKRADPSYVRGYLETQYEYLRQVGSGGGSTKGALTCAFLRDIPIPFPNLDEQREIVKILDAIDRKIDLHKRKRGLLEVLFKSLLHKLMAGAIRVADLDLSALRLAEKPEAAE